jgi:hypothetical protein
VIKSKTSLFWEALKKNKRGSFFLVNTLVTLSVCL